jgi:hypothetical protein
MITAIVGFVLALSPLAAVVALLELARWRERRIESAVARQIELTDAIAAELGAVVAPVVSRPVRGPWRVRMALPVGRAATAARILAIAHRTLGRTCASGYELVLTPQAPPARVPRGPVTATPRVPRVPSVDVA